MSATATGGPAARSGATATAGQTGRLRVRVQGTVQGVGFRPFVYRLATELGLDGYVLNDASGVLLEIEGRGSATAAFLARLDAEAPPLSIIERIEHEPVEAVGSPGFEILASPHGEAPAAPVSADSATCEACLRELSDPGDRRFRYPFINCTDCGPRFTIVRGIPYDRRLTTMAGFAMCERCRREYEDPTDRRFHAQPNACPACGPRVSLLDRDGKALAATADHDAVVAAASALSDGAILAVKGIGGYHLACRADAEDAVARLRARKHREDKPFALLAADLGAAERLVELNEAARALLCSPPRPIVLAPRRANARVAASVAPANPELGVMLPYSPLHHLLAGDVARPLVLTSGNVSEEPIAFDDADALARLSAIADLFLVHDRPIETRTDDSVVRSVSVGGEDRPAFLRRSRGYVPASLTLPGGTPRQLLACGAQLKNTFCVAKGERAWVSHHIGDLENAETLQSFTTGVEHFKRLFAVAPELVVHDLHPEYLSTKYALERDGVDLLAVQHHHAHLAAVLAEHGEGGRAVGAIFDGTGYGPDGSVWGGELLVGDVGSSRRFGALHPVRLPGGAQAIRQPWRMACAWLQGSGEDAAAPPSQIAGAVSRERWRAVAGLARGGLASPMTTSAGRLFDAIAALCGIRTEVSYEGQAAIELEAACDPAERGAYPLPVCWEGAFLSLDARETIRTVSEEVLAGRPVAQIAARFHGALAAAVVEACARLAGEHGTEVAVLTGGVFANRRLLQDATAGLTARGLRVLTPAALPAGDGAISYGQVATAAWGLRG